MKFPQPLKKQDTIGLVSVSSPISAQRLLQCVQAVERLGYKVKAADNLTEQYRGYMAGSEFQRACWINEMFENPEIKAVFCVRGGHGSSRIMEYLDYDIIRENPKIFVGYSDVTNLHLAFNKMCNLITFHGPMVSSNLVDNPHEETLRSFLSAMEGQENYTFANPKGFPMKVLKEGKGRGRLVGGNLSLISASMGTPYEVDTAGKVLFVEEVNETMGKIEKWLYHLRNCGKLKGCRGILMGQFTHMKDCSHEEILTCMKDATAKFDIPVFYNIQSGHGRPMMTLPMGAMCGLDTSKGTVNFDFEKE